jgi:peptide/nickel transport system permease protein
MMVRLTPGDPALAVAGENASPEQVQEVRHELGLDQPLLQQFRTYVSDVLHGDLGTSFQFHAPVSDLLSEAIPASAELAGTALALVAIFAIPGGMLAAALTKDGRHRRLEATFTTVTSVTGAIPEFLLATFLSLVFAVWLGWFPIAGSKGAKTLVLPALALAVRPIMVIMRIVRVETINVLHQDYVRTARSKRLPERIVYSRHALPNVLTAALTIGGTLFTAIIASAIVVDNVFGRAGVGTLLVQAILARDYPVIQGIVLFLGITVVLVNTVVDIVLVVVDPRRALS